MSSITIAELALWQRGKFEFTLLDVRRAKVRQADDADILDGRWLDPALWLDWKDGIKAGAPVVVYCAHGHEISQGLTAALRAMGVDARHLEGGYSAWRAAGEPVRAHAGL
ncbi:MAG: rhodanese-like domain-containing protein [Rubrivivax sp.]|nr:rhodanese-like domain-containing protein [Rubrivivax sp.]MDP3086458.1 rhodanese-like domain-containing protein [Rubrivivax sp.]